MQYIAKHVVAKKSELNDSLVAYYGPQAIYYWPPSYISRKYNLDSTIRHYPSTIFWGADVLSSLCCATPQICIPLTIIYQFKQYTIYIMKR